LFGVQKMLINDLGYFKRSANYSDKYSGMDCLEKCTDKEWFKNYPIQDFDYKFNSWGFRGPEYNQYISKPVNICLGDSFTVNVGGPIEHSWPSLLQEKFDIPCLNLGMDGAGNDSIRLVYDRACKLFDVQKTFVVYSFFHRRLENGRFMSEPHEHIDNIIYFEKNFINDTYFNFIPPWCWTDEELDYISSRSKFYINLNYKSWNDTLDRQYCYREQYNQLKGADWPTYDEFLAGADPHPDVYTQEFRLRTNLYSNRDGFHLSLEGNQKLADNLYEQTK